MTRPAVATYGSGPRFLIGFSPARLVLRRGSFVCVPPDAEDLSTAPAALLVWQRRDLQDWSSDRVELGHATLAAGAVVGVAGVGNGFGFRSIRLPSEWTAHDPLRFVISVNTSPPGHLR